MCESCTASKRCEVRVEMEGTKIWFPQKKRDVNEHRVVGAFFKKGDAHANSKELGIIVIHSFQRERGLLTLYDIMSLEDMTAQTCLGLHQGIVGGTIPIGYN